jgi:hypothetical protein
MGKKPPVVPGQIICTARGQRAGIDVFRYTKLWGQSRLALKTVMAIPPPILICAVYQEDGFADSSRWSVQVVSKQYVGEAWVDTGF